ncbi:hypothetical protein DVJ77_15275 [Dyella tabacisoli]|uniref:Uncharacterized protein n=2 Tax=Dyella tabacisoli TaxID=2282381 RepID=A0A369UJX0_9GAMM|nr:hypothetical protein DVJ77_15275 [Dyella tabacisoli]
MKAIEAEIKENEGIYPFNRGRLSIAEVCRRARVHEITMMGPTHKKTTLPMIKNWMENLGAIKGSRRIKTDVTRRSDEAKYKYVLIASQFQAMYQVEMPERDKEIEQLRGKVAELEAENLQLRAQNSESRVIRLPVGGRGNK